MKKNKEIILYENYEMASYEACEQEMIEQYYYENPNAEKGYKPKDYEVYGELEFMDQMYWNCFKEELLNFMGNDMFVMNGYIERWNGSFPGGTVFDDFDELSCAWNRCDYIKFYERNGHLHLECSHHDGTHHFEIRKLNENGRRYYENHADEIGCPWLYEKLMTPRYSKLPRFWKTICGY